MRIAVTRLREKAGGDRDLCRRFGHECFTVSPLRAGIHEDRITGFVDAVHAGRYECLFFTSALPAQLIAPQLTRWPRVIAIGPKTASVLSGAGIDCETLPHYYSRDFVPYCGGWLKGRVVGIPRADVPNPQLLDGIAAAGGIAEEIRVYSLIPTGERLELGDAEAILFTSANSFRAALWKRREGLCLIAIGEITAEAMREGGMTADVVGDGSLEGTLGILNARMSGGARDDEGIHPS